MSRNKLIWNIALFLIMIVTLPIAYAQTFTGIAGSRIFFVLINAAVIGIVLFVLQAILIPNKADKERTSVWIIVALASLLIAWFYGDSGYIWQIGPLARFFSIKLIVNSIILSAISYFALAFIPKLDLKSREGNIGLWVLIFVISFAIAYHLSPDKFLWEQGNIFGAYHYLFSSEQCNAKGCRPGQTLGVLHYKGGLFVLLTGFIIIYFFLQNYLLKQGSKTLNFLMAGLFAVLMASPPANPLKDVVLMGEFFFVFIFFETLKTSIGPQSNKGKWGVFLLSILIVSLISAALTVRSPEHRGVLGTIGCHIPIIGPTCETADGGTTTGAPLTPESGSNSMTFKIIFVVLVSLIVGVVVYYLINKYATGATDGGDGTEVQAGAEPPAGNEGERV